MDGSKIRIRILSFGIFSWWKLPNHLSPSRNSFSSGNVSFHITNSYSHDSYSNFPFLRKNALCESENCRGQAEECPCSETLEGKEEKWTPWIYATAKQEDCSKFWNKVPTFFPLIVSKKYNTFSGASSWCCIYLMCSVSIKYAQYHRLEN